MLSTRQKNSAAIVSKELSQYDCFGSHIGRPSASHSNGFKYLVPERNNARSSLYHYSAIMRLSGRWYFSFIKTLYCLFSEPCEQRSYGGTGYGMCCHFPFTYNGTKYDKCITDNSDSPWCATTFDFNADNKWGYCKETIEDTRELSINKRRY